MSEEMILACTTYAGWLEGKDVTEEELVEFQLFYSIFNSIYRLLWSNFVDDVKNRRESPYPIQNKTFSSDFHGSHNLYMPEYGAAQSSRTPIVYAIAF